MNILSAFTHLHAVPNLTFFCWTQKMIFWRMLVTQRFQFLLTSIVFFVHTIEVNGNRKLFSYQHSSKISSFHKESDTGKTLDYPFRKQLNFLVNSTPCLAAYIDHKYGYSRCVCRQYLPEWRSTMDEGLHILPETRLPCTRPPDHTAPSPAAADPALEQKRSHRPPSPAQTGYATGSPSLRTTQDMSVSLRCMIRAAAESVQSDPWPLPSNMPISWAPMAMATLEMRQADTFCACDSRS